MNTTKLTVLAATLLAALFVPAVLLAEHDDDDDDDEGEHHEARARGHGERGRAREGGAGEARGKGAAGALEGGTAAVQASPGFAEYKEECGSCHLAYPPGLLPARSWVKLLDGLGDHFGQNAEVEPAVRARLGAWLSASAAESGSHPMSRRVVKSAGQGAPLRISELGFIRHEHDEVGADVWARPAVKTVANCGACHQGAERWNFDEHGVRIPR